jgi:hypothetical protein
MHFLSLCSMKQVRGYFQNDSVFSIAAIFAIVGAFSFGCLAFLSLVINLDFAFHAPPLDSRIVGWSTLHQYPKQQESFYYIAGVVTIVSSTLGALVVWLWSAAVTASASRAALPHSPQGDIAYISSRHLSIMAYNQPLATFEGSIHSLVSASDYSAIPVVLSRYILDRHA